MPAGSFLYELAHRDVDMMTILKIGHGQCGLIGIEFDLEDGITRPVDLDFQSAFHVGRHPPYGRDLPRSNVDDECF
jgi:hypothetical protein